jgi:predicted secreted Zn-dependent protease
MSGKELSNHVHKTAIKHIVSSDEHRSLSNHNQAHGGSGDLQYRIHTKHYGGGKGFQSVQAASAKKDKDGYTHHVTFNLHKNSASTQPESHLKTHAEKKITLPWHTSSEDVKKHEESHKRSNGG